MLFRSDRRPVGVGLTVAPNGTSSRAGGGFPPLFEGFTTAFAEWRLAIALTHDRLVSRVPDSGNLAGFGVVRAVIWPRPLVDFAGPLTHKRARPRRLSGCRGLSAIFMVPSAATQAGDLLTLSDGGVSRVAKGADCKSAALWLRRFESCLPHHNGVSPLFSL